MPCAVCGLSGLTVVDHIVPIANGGGGSRENLQSLCVQCNAKKMHRLTNDQLREWVESRREDHNQFHEYTLATRHHNAFDRPSFWAWKAQIGFTGGRS